MNYTRTFVLQSSHFNGQEQYDLIKRADEHMAAGNYSFAIAPLRSALHCIHGHNFIVCVGITADPMEGKDYVIDDEALERTVRSYDRCNLSMHPSFYRGHKLPHIRATTERLAEAISADVRWHLRDNGVESGALTVSVKETTDIEASHFIVWGEGEEDRA